MNILFVYSTDFFQSPRKLVPQEIHYGISYISAILKEHGHHTELVILNRFFDKKNIINKYIKRFCPELICFTAVTTEYPLMLDVARYIKRRYKDIYLLIGGSHASLSPQDVLVNAFDALCIGEGEYPALELVSQLEKGITPSNIPNLWIKKDSAVEKNYPRPFYDDLDSLPFPDLEMWRQWLANPAYGILLGRGCPFLCTYCCNHALRKLAPGTYVRRRSPENIIKEIKEITVKFPGIEQIYLEVETIGLDMPWFFELCAKLQDFNATRKQPLKFGTNLRIVPNMDMERFFPTLKKSNFSFVNIGVESGSERIRHEVLKRDYSNQDIIKAARLAREYGLRINFSNMIGILGETMADFQETIKLNRICLPDVPDRAIFFPYPGTDLFSLCEKQGLLKGRLDMDMERAKAVLDLPGFPKKQIQKNYLWFEYNVYKGHKPVFELWVMVVRTRVLSNYYLKKYLFLSKFYYFFRKYSRVFIIYAGR